MFSQRAFPHLSKDLIADSSSQFIGEVFIREGCEIGENCIIDASHFRIAINENCKIGNNTRVIADSDKIEIGPHVVIGDNCLITKSVTPNTVIEDNKQHLS